MLRLMYPLAFLKCLMLNPEAHNELQSEPSIYSTG